MNQKIEAYISQAKNLRMVRSDAPSVGIFATNVFGFVKKNWPQHAALFSALAWSNSMFVEEQLDYQQRMDDLIEFLNQMKDESSISAFDDFETNKPNKVRIVIGPKDADLVGLHTKIKDGCTKLFMESNYSEAVEKSFKIVRARLRDLSGFETASEAFGKTTLHIQGAAGIHA
ncbi:MAG TPA: TIGR02391 family protein, partial [Candidatus Dormibacteraeota bacterium]|nr:TIGR02391 family protein [Candidatus Dormibacteraeota bacterium]